MASITALLLPLRDVTVPLKKGRTEPLSSHIINNSLKWKKSDSASTATVHAELPALAELHAAVAGALLYHQNEDWSPKHNTGDQRGVLVTKEQHAVHAAVAGAPLYHQNEDW